jgi:tetratricopeptide (TPR) repeat protein
VRVRRDHGAAYERARRIPEAVRAYRAVLAKEPASTAAWTGLGHAQAAGGESDDAVVALEVATRLGATDRGAFALLGDLELAAGLPDASALAYERAANGEKPEIEDLERLGVARMRAGDAQGALVALDAVLARDGRRGRARLTRAEALEALGRKGEARAALEDLARDPGADAYGEAARARLGASR